MQPAGLKFALHFPHLFIYWSGIPTYHVTTIMSRKFLSCNFTLVNFGQVLWVLV